jgi:hypothetical protein
LNERAPVIRTLRAVQSFMRTADMAVLLAIFVVVWSVFAAISQSSGAINNDMGEAYSWGHEFQLGYHKHPPFWAWIAGAWFLVLPRTGWAFMVLSVLNSAVGLWGAWLLIGRFAKDDRRRAATLLLLLTPFYIFLALKFNANSIFLSLWPWTVYFFMRSIDDGRLTDAAAFGALMAFNGLSKYIAVLLGLTCLAAAWVHSNRRRYFTSASPYVSVAVGLVLFAPHVWWLFNNDFLPFQYFFEDKTGQSVTWSSWLSLKLLVGALLFHLPMLAVLMASGAQSPRAWPGTLRKEAGDPRFRTLAVLALLPLILTAISGIAFRIEVDSNMTIGMFPLLPLLLIIIIIRPDDRRLLDTASPLIAAVLVGSLLVSPLVAVLRLRYGDISSSPVVELANEATEIWRETTGTRLALVAGTKRYVRTVSFYSQDEPSEFIAFDLHRAPWVTPEDLRRKGLLAICDKGDSECLATAAKFVTEESSTTEVTLVHEFFGYRGDPETFVLVIVPSRQDYALTQH